MSAASWLVVFLWAAVQPGTPSPHPAIRADAAEANRAGGKLYQAKDFRAAERAFRRALSLDETFLAPRLNLAAALARMERFDEAADVAVELVRIAPVPWAAEVAAETDLIVLRGKPAWLRIESAARAAAIEWGARVQESTLLLARTGKPLAAGSAADIGVFMLRPRQEVFGWNPATKRFFQVTADNGRVIGFSRSGDGGAILVATGDKVVRSAGGQVRLRGLVARVVSLRDLQPGPPLALADDADAVVLGFDGGRIATVDAYGANAKRFRAIGDRWVQAANPPRGPAKKSRTSTIVTGHGVAAAAN